MQGRGLYIFVEDENVEHQQERKGVGCIYLLKMKMLNTNKSGMLQVANRIIYLH